MVVYIVVSKDREKRAAVFLRREDAERFLAEAYADDAALAVKLRLDPIELVRP